MGPAAQVVGCKTLCNGMHKTGGFETPAKHRPSVGAGSTSGANPYREAERPLDGTAAVRVVVTLPGDPGGSTLPPR